MVSATESNEIVKALQKSSDLVHSWAAEGPSGEANVRALLTVEGISVWDIMAVDLALYQIPNGLAGQPERRTLRQIVMPYLRRLKYTIRKLAPIDNGDCVRWPSGNTVLFLGFTAYMARDILEPVAEMLLRESELVPVMLVEDDTTVSGAAAVLRHSVCRHRGQETAIQSREFGRVIREACAILTNDHRYRRIFADEGRQLWPSIGNRLRNAFNVYASFILPDIVAIARHILAAHRPSVIVSPDVADPRTRVYTLLGRALGIPTVEMQFGACSSESIEWRFLEADIAAVWGEQSRDIFLSQGVPQERVRVTGSPRHDALFSATSHEISDFRKRFRIPSQDRMVVFASSYYIDAYDNLSDIASALRSMKIAVIAAAAATSGVSLIVKPHPLEDVGDIRALATNNARVAFAEPADDIRALTRACDGFFSVGSAATLDALILGKPTVCLAFPNWYFSELFVRGGAVVAPRSGSEVAAAMGEIAADGGAAMLRRHAVRRSEFLSSWVHDGGKGATSRVAELLKSMAHRKVAEESNA